MNIAAASTRPTRKSPCAQQHVSACFLHSRKVCRAHGKVRTESATARPSKKMPPSRDTLAAASTARRLPVRATIDSALFASAPVSASKASLLRRRASSSGVTTTKTWRHPRSSTWWLHLRLSHAITRTEPSSSWPQRAKYTTPVAAYAAPAPTCKHMAQLSKVTKRSASSQHCAGP